MLRAILGRIDPLLAANCKIASADAQCDAKRASITSLFKNNQMSGTVLLWLVFFLNLAAFYFMQSWLPTILGKLHYPMQTIVWMMSLSTIGGIATAFVVGPSMDRIGPIPTSTNPQSKLIAETRNAGMAVTTYCGMAVGRAFAEPVLKDIAARHGKSVAQVVLQWLGKQDGVVALSRTTNPDRVAENVAIFDFDQDQREMASISSLVTPGGRIVNPPGIAPQWD